ncbi:MAG: hypothetical protein ACI8SC_002060 [Colwellia sp.]|jgi:hypothetical protein
MCQNKITAKITKNFTFMILHIKNLLKLPILNTNRDKNQFI